MAMDEDGCLPLGAQHQNQGQGQGQSGEGRDAENEEGEHFQQVCQSYQQYATFHQTRQQGVNHRMYQMLKLNSPPNNENNGYENNICTPCPTSTCCAPTKNEGGGEGEGPTIESILPPSLLPQTQQNQQYQKQFCDTTIRNQFFLDNVLKYSGVMTSQEVLRQRREPKSKELELEWATEDQMSKIDSVLKSVARDWSSEGREERSVAYDRMVGALERYMPLLEHFGGTDAPRVAVPGSGLGRLAWEIYSRGYSVQGSDFSLPMLLASDFMLNGCGISSDGEGENSPNGGSSNFKQFAISPWISETKNVTSVQNRIRTVVVPDVDPTSLQHNENNDGDTDNGFAAPEFTMMAGEFLSLYAHFLPSHGTTSCNESSHHQHHPESTNKFHAVVCSFFLDTAPSLPHYLLTIYHMLEEGGLLINFGPLMYHWSGHGELIPGDLNNNHHATNSSSNGDNNSISSMYQKRNKHLDQRYLSSIDYTWEEVRYMVVQCGFEIVEEEMYIPVRYTSDAKSMMKVDYDCVFMVARKKAANGK